MEVLKRSQSITFCAIAFCDLLYLFKVHIPAYTELYLTNTLYKTEMLKHILLTLLLVIDL